MSACGTVWAHCAQIAIGLVVTSNECFGSFFVISRDNMGQIYIGHRFLNLCRKPELQNIIKIKLSANVRLKYCLGPLCANCDRFSGHFKWVFWVFFVISRDSMGQIYNGHRFLNLCRKPELQNIIKISLSANVHLWYCLWPTVRELR